MLGTMRTTLVSDAHLNGLADPNQASLVDFLRRWETDELVLVGDVFDAWWGWSHAVYSAYVPLLGTLWDLRRRGVRVTWVGGNHDFFAGTVIQQDLGIAVAPRWEGRAGAQRVVAIHGDEADVSWGQRALTMLLRGPVAHGVMRILGPGAGWSLSRKLSGHSRAHGGPGLERILDAQRVLADRMLGTDADVLCVGHSHAPGVETRTGGTLVNLGDWLDHRTFAVVEDAVELRHWTGETAIPIDPGGMRRRV